PVCSPIQPEKETWGSVASRYSCPIIVLLPNASIGGRSWRHRSTGVPSPRMLTHTTRALQLLFQTIREIDTLEEFARLGMTAVELSEGDAPTLRELMQAVEARATDLRDQLQLFPAVPVEVPPASELAPAPPELVSEWCAQVRTMGPDELDAIELLTHKHW